MHWPASGHVLRAAVDDRGRVLGAMLLHRAAENTCFSARERTRLALIVPYVARLLTAPRAAFETPWVDSEEEGLLTLDAAGGVRHLSSEARRLLYLVAHPVISIGTPTPHVHAPGLSQAVKQLCRRLLEVLRDQATGTRAGTWCCRNIWGEFQFRVCRLNNPMLLPAPAIGITIRRREPLPLKLMRQMKQLALSDRQTQVCLLLVAGHSRPTIAERLDMSRHTAITYTRQVYDKLGVHSRCELLSRLLLL